ncbi:hypothetical protein FRC01_003865 [Tulasnella sp. 417]|nr:hypothetical protein FRC01_003865 [Tulasnella sp. 417]
MQALVSLRPRNSFKTLLQRDSLSILIYHLIDKSTGDSSVVPPTSPRASTRHFAAVEAGLDQRRLRKEQIKHALSSLRELLAYDESAEGADKKGNQEKEFKLETLERTGEAYEDDELADDEDDADEDQDMDPSRPRWPPARRFVRHVQAVVHPSSTDLLVSTHVVFRQFTGANVALS